MISDHFQKLDLISSRTLFMFAGGLVIVCQLVAMALVSDGQVKKAQLRNLGVASQQAAFAQCLEASVGNGGQRCSLPTNSAAGLSNFSETRVSSELQASRVQPSGLETAGRLTPYGNAEGFALKQFTDSQADLLRVQSPSAPGLTPLVYIGH